MRAPDNPSGPRAVAISIVLLLAAVLLQWALRPVLGARVPFLFFYPAVGIAAMWCGWRPAVLVLAGGVLNAIWWLDPDGHMAWASAGGATVLIGFALGGGILLAIGGWSQRLRSRAALAELALERKVRDLAERDTALRTASADSRKLQVALDTSAVPFCLVRPIKDDGGELKGFRWEYVNAAAARLARRSPQELLGQPVAQSLAGTLLEPGLRGRAWAALQSGQTVQFETWSEVRGRRHWFQLIMSPYDDGLAIWFADVTQRKLQEESLREADRRKDEFVATLAHELRNPLAPIRQAALVAKAPMATDAQKRWSYDVIERQVGHMALLLDDLLDVSRITRGKLELRKAPTQLARIVDSALEATRPQIESRQQSLTVDLPAAPVWLDADPVRMAQVLINLLTNASKYTQPQGEIAVRAQVQDHELRLKVCDNGMGIPPEALDGVFEMFTQVRAQGESEGSGLGIGLALSRGLVELHGGRLTAHSEGRGRGSTFEVRIPAAPPPAATEAAPDPHKGTGRRRRVLVADDNRDAAESLADLLRMEGHEVAVAFDGEQALGEYQRFAPEVALLDIGMPGLTGNQVATAIRARPEGAATLLVAITGWGQDRDRAASREAGFDFHFTKPVDPQRVLGLLESA